MESLGTGAKGGLEEALDGETGEYSLKERGNASLKERGNASLRDSGGEGGKCFNY